MKRREFLRYSALGGLVLSSAGYMVFAASREHRHAMAPAMLPEGGQPLQPLPRIANLSDEAGRFRSVLTPAPQAVPLGDEFEARLWLYNGKVAPLIEVREGDELDITLINELEQETTLHWHGVPVPQAQDGAPGMPWRRVSRVATATPSPRAAPACTGSIPIPTRAPPDRWPMGWPVRCWCARPRMYCRWR
jgi:FtsP/CotA-like multicopper oxidase with cupredoxin domain